MMKGFFTAALAALAVSAAVLALAGCSDGGGNKASPVSGTVDMTRMTADEVKTAIGAALNAGITEFKLTGEFAKIGIPARVSFSGTPPVGNPFYDSGVEKIDLTGVTYDYNDEYEKGYVYEQTPKAGEMVKGGRVRTISLKVSLGKENNLMPDLAGQSEANAMSQHMRTSGATLSPEAMSMICCRIQATASSAPPSRSIAPAVTKNVALFFR